MKKQSNWTLEQVPDWKGPFPKIQIDINELGDFTGKIIWKDKVIEQITYSRHSTVLSACKRRRVIIMRKILNGQIK